jgi:hypothetical protein
MTRKDIIFLIRKQFQHDLEFEFATSKLNKRNSHISDLTQTLAVYMLT